MIITNDIYTIFENFDEAIDNWETCKSKLKLWPEDGRLKTINSKAKTVNFTKTHCKIFDSMPEVSNLFNNPDEILKQIKNDVNMFHMSNSVNLFHRSNMSNSVDMSNVINFKTNPNKSKTVKADKSFVDSENFYDLICKNYNIKPDNKHLLISLICLLIHLAFENITLENFENNIHSNSNDSSDDEANTGSEAETTLLQAKDIKDSNMFENISFNYPTNFYDEAIEIFKNTPEEINTKVIERINGKTPSEFLTQNGKTPSEFQHEKIKYFNALFSQLQQNNTVEINDLLIKVICKIVLDILKRHNVNLCNCAWYGDKIDTTTKKFYDYLNKKTQSKHLNFDIVEKNEEVGFLYETYNLVNKLPFNVVINYEVKYHDICLINSKSVDINFILDAIQHSEVCVVICYGNIENLKSKILEIANCIELNNLSECVEVLIIDFKKQK